MKQLSSLKKESIRFKESPFTFRLSEEKVLSRKKRPGRAPVAVACMFCGSVKLLGDANRRAYEKSGRAFCDEDCACGWKSIYYASKSFEHFEKSRVETRQRKLNKKHLAIQSRQKRMLETIDRNKAKLEERKQKGWLTCDVCSNTVWSESHSSKKRFCSDACRKEAWKAHSRNRRRLIQSRSFGSVITLRKLFKRDGGRCNACGTKCVKPEGYNQPNEANIDHVMPLSKGGLHTWSNVQLLCRTCNMAKKDKVLPGTQLMLDLRLK